LIVAEEPPVLTDLGSAPDPLTNYLAETWGIILGNDLVVDQSSNQPTFAVGSQWGSHAITQQLTGYVVILPTARSVTLEIAPSGVSQSTLVSTSTRAWAETNLEALQGDNPQAAPDQNADILGPVPLAAAAENFDTKSRIVVFGDADFATDNFFVAYANGDFFINSVDWAVGQENLINLTPKDTTQRFMAPPQSATMNLILLGTVVVLPGLALVGGIVAFVQRRRRG